MEVTDTASTPTPAAGEDWRRVRELLLGEDRVETRELQDRVVQLETALAELRAVGARRASLFRYYAKPLGLALAGIVAVSAVLTGWSWWRHQNVARAVAACEQIPGMKVTATQIPWLGKARLSGLRDPYGPTAEQALTDRNLDPGSLVLDFLSYPSADTPWAEKRERQQAKLVEDLRAEVISTVGDLDAARETVRRRDVETMTRALFRLQFPQANGQVDISLEDDRWKVRGNADEPLYADLIRKLPGLTLTGEVDTSELRDATFESLVRLKLEIEEITLVYISGSAELSEDGHRQAARMVRLLGQLEDLARRLDQMPPDICVHSLPIVGEGTANSEVETARIADTERRILDQSGFDGSRIRPGVRDDQVQEGRVGTYVRILPGMSTAATIMR